ncbi:MAG: PepSY domain-containing protein, partial [Lachnospiraceae bacterium]|nr:PepSY domain-containing protein [Lachnospiraceae bacterium]
AIALQKAGLKEKDVTFSKAKLENDDGKKEYDIEFYRGGYEYEYEIDALTGKITDESIEIDDDDDD